MDAISLTVGIFIGIVVGIVLGNKDIRTALIKVAREISEDVRRD